MLRAVILLFALGPLVYYLLALWASTTYFWKERRRRAQRPGYTPPVSILKPVRGLDPQAYENFASFCFQDYPEYEVLFCVNQETDSAVPVIRELQAAFPERQIRLLIGAPSTGASGKVNKLCRLAREARYDLLVVSDSDIRVEANYLREIAEPFQDEKVGAVTVFFRSITSAGLGAALDSAGSAVEFAASALLAQKLEGVHFTLGATMAVNRKILAEIGGFEALANHYVDDYEIGRRVAERGYRVVFARTPVSMIYPRESLIQFFRHELRWTIGLRNVRPFGHAAVGLILGLPWTLLALLAAPSARVAWIYFFGYLGLRYAVYLIIGAWGLRDSSVRRNWWLAPFRDAAIFAVWVASFFSNHITWRGLEFRVKNGILIPVSSRPSAVPACGTDAAGMLVEEQIAASARAESVLGFGSRSSPTRDLRFEEQTSYVD